MSGHSKWHSIKYKKGAADAKRGKIFTKHAKLIAIAARDGGADPEMNPGLRTAIVNAKSDNVPNANIDKAVKKGSGTGKDAMVMDEIMYEGFGPAGTAVYIQVLTDNKNRSVANVKTALTKNGGNMGAAGTVGWMFEKKGLIIAKPAKLDHEEAELIAIDAGADDIAINDGVFEIYTDPSLLMKMREALEKAGFEIEKAEFDFVPNNPVKMESIEDAKKVLRLLDAIEEDEDVVNVYSNFDIPDEMMKDL